MEPNARQMISGYKLGVVSFEGTLGEEHPKVKEARDALDRLTQLAESSSDYGAFCTAAMPLFGELGKLMEELAKAKPAPGARKGSAKGSTAQAAAVYRMTLSGIDPADESKKPLRQALERILELEKTASSADAFRAAVVSQGLDLEVARQQQMGIAGSAGGFVADQALDSPVLAHHYAFLRRELSAAKSLPELEHTALAAAELMGVEGAWDNILVTYAMKAIGEVIGLLMDKSETQQRTAEESYRFVCGFFGMDWHEIWRVPRVKSRFQMIYDRSRSTWVAERGCNDADQARDFLTTIWQAIMEGKAAAQVGPEENKRGFVLWGKEVELMKAEEVLKDPPRPKISRFR